MSCRCANFWDDFPLSFQHVREYKTSSSGCRSKGLTLRGKMTVAGFTETMMQLENTGDHFTAVHIAKYSHRCYLLQLALWSKSWYLWLTLFSWLQHKHLCHLKWFLVSDVLTNLLSLTVNSNLRNKKKKRNVGTWVTLGLFKVLGIYLIIEIKLDFS